MECRSGASLAPDDCLRCNSLTAWTPRLVRFFFQAPSVAYITDWSVMFDPVQAPSLRHAFELVNAVILEADSRL